MSCLKYETSREQVFRYPSVILLNFFYAFHCVKYAGVRDSSDLCSPVYGENLHIIFALQDGQNLFLYGRYRTEKSVYYLGRKFITAKLCTDGMSLPALLNFFLNDFALIPLLL